MTPGAAVRQSLRAGAWLLLVVGVLFLVMFWPQSLGGQVAYVKVDGHSMDPTFHNGDLAVVRRQSSYRVGDPVAYRIPKGEFGAGALVIHRLVGGDGVTGYTTKGDNKNRADDWHPRTADILGRVRYDIPGAGNRVATMTRPVYVGALVAGLTVLVMLIPSRPKRTRRTRTTARHGTVRPSELVLRGHESAPVGPSRRSRGRRHIKNRSRRRRDNAAARSAP